MANKDDFKDVEIKVDNKVTAWLAEIDDAKKREKDYRKDGKKIHDIYNGSKEEKIPFNILYSNTETLLPALYSSVPRPVVQRRFKDDDNEAASGRTAVSLSSVGAGYVADYLGGVPLLRGLYATVTGSATFDIEVESL